MPIEPDYKDWTWVLDRPCPECGFNTSSFPRAQIGPMIRDNAARWVELLAQPEAGARPADDTWSALEYGCHVRDVFRLYETRLRLMLNEDGAEFADWDQNETAVAERYSEQDPSRVARELHAAALTLSTSFDELRDADWQRVGARGDGARFTVESFGRYMIHDPIHHLDDVEKGYARLRAG